MKTYPKIMNKLEKIPANHFWEITEKVDSSNFRFEIDTWTYGTRTTSIDLNSVPKNFQSVVHTLENVLPDLKALIQRKFAGYTLFGEAMTGRRGNKITYQREIDGGVAWFDVFDGNDCRWLLGPEKIEVFMTLNTILGTEHCNLKFSGYFPTLEEIEAYLAEESFLGGKREGIVIKPWDDNLYNEYGERIVYKIVSPEYREKAKTKRPKVNKDIMDEIADIFLTEMRIRKSQTRLTDLGLWEESFPSKNIGPMIKDITHDIISEHKPEIMEALFKKFTKHLASETAAAVIKYLEGGADNESNEGNS